MEDLINTLSGNMHVSQESYDLKALQDYLASTIAIPNALSSAHGMRPLAPSRSASSTRKHLHPALIPDQHLHLNAPYPSPGVSSTPGFWNSADDVSMTTPMNRPAGVRRTSSYGFGGSSAQPVPPAKAGGWTFGNENYGGFQDDAFAPLNTQSRNEGWAAFHAPKMNPWAGFGGPSNTFPRVTVQEAPQAQPNVQQPTFAGGRLEEEDAMDEEWADQSMEEVEDEDSVEDAMGFDEGEVDVPQMGYGALERGRRKA